MAKFRFLDDVAIADAAFVAEGKNLEDLFSNCALATFEVIANTKKVEPKKSVSINLTYKNLDRLLFDWLSELIYLKDLKKMIFSKFDIKISSPKASLAKEGDEYKLKAKAWGEGIDYKKHQIRLDVKAVTYHLFEIKKEKNKWKAKIILDV